LYNSIKFSGADKAIEEHDLLLLVPLLLLVGGLDHM